MPPYGIKAKDARPLLVREYGDALDWVREYTKCLAKAQKSLRKSQLVSALAAPDARVACGFGDRPLAKLEEFVNLLLAAKALEEVGRGDALVVGSKVLGGLRGRPARPLPRHRSESRERQHRDRSRSGSGEPARSHRRVETAAAAAEAPVAPPVPTEPSVSTGAAEGAGAAWEAC